MKKASVIRLSEKAPRQRAHTEIGEGLVPGRIVRIDGDSIEVELLSGGTVQAIPADDIESGFVAECLRARRTVLVTRAGEGILLLGALQTSSQIAASGGESTVRAKRFVVDASEGIVLRVGQTEVSLDAAGVVRFAGEKMSVAVAKVFRVLSATAELP